MSRLGAPVSTGTDCAYRLRAITPDDDNDLPDGACAAVFVGETGDVSIIAADDSEAVTLSAVAAGILPVRAKRILATDTTATGLVAFYN